MLIIWSNFSEDMVMVCSAFAASPPPSPLDCFFFFGFFSFASSSDELDLSEETDFLRFFSFLPLLVVLLRDVFLCTTVFLSVSDSELLELLLDEEEEDESLETFLLDL